MFSKTLTRSANRGQLPQWLRCAAVIAAALLLAGCQQKMADQPSYKPLTPSTFFDDGRSARPLVEGTVPRGHLRIDKAYYTGRTGEVAEPEAGQASAEPESEQAPAEAEPASRTEATGSGTEARVRGFDESAKFAEQFPIPINQAVIRHGYHRFMIYCVVCHDPLGTGRGKIIERGYTTPPSYHIDRLRNAPPGRLFAVVTEGYGSMPSYASQIPVEDRWAIVAYVRTLQLSQHFPEEELTAEMREALDAADEQAGSRGGQASGEESR